jgi:hypothetical protein
MVTVARLLAVVALPVTAAVALAVPAQAQPPLLNGAYNEAGGDPLNVWTFATTCGLTGCTGTVSSNTGWTAPVAFTDGRWTFTVSKPGGLICDDGTYQPAVSTISVDPGTLGGDLSSDSNYGCSGGTVSHTPIQLVKVG